MYGKLLWHQMQPQICKSPYQDEGLQLIMIIPIRLKAGPMVGTADREAYKIKVEMSLLAAIRAKLTQCQLPNPVFSNDLTVDWYRADKVCYTVNKITVTDALRYRSYLKAKNRLKYWKKPV